MYALCDVTEFTACLPFTVDVSLEVFGDVHNERAEKYSPGDSLVVRCIQGFVFSTEEQIIVLKCDNDGEWNPQPRLTPDCIKQVTPLS